jgi:hypothetical protein
VSRPNKNETHPYVVVLKSNNKKIIEQTGWLSSLFSIVLFFFSLYQDPNKIGTYAFAIATIIALIIIAIRKKQKKNIAFFPLLNIAGAGMILTTDIPFIGILLLIAAIVERRISIKKEIGFSDAGIKFNYKRGKIVLWSELNNVMLRDGLLTIDFNNNTLIQVDTDDEENADYEVTEDEFNAYCRTQLNKA